jgi:hypothetical protein
VARYQLHGRRDTVFSRGMGLLSNESSIAFLCYCQNAYGLDIATENRPISHLGTVKYNIFPLISGG